MRSLSAYLRVLTSHNEINNTEIDLLPRGMYTSKSSILGEEKGTKNCQITNVTKKLFSNIQIAYCRKKKATKTIVELKPTFF